MSPKSGQVSYNQFHVHKLLVATLSIVVFIVLVSQCNARELDQFPVVYGVENYGGVPQRGTPPGLALELAVELGCKNLEGKLDNVSNL